MSQPKQRLTPTKYRQDSREYIKDRWIQRCTKVVSPFDPTKACNKDYFTDGTVWHHRGFDIDRCDYTQFEPVEPGTLGPRPPTPSPVQPNKKRKDSPASRKKLQL